MNGVQALEDGAAKWANIRTLTISNEYAVVRAVQQSEALQGAARWEEVYELLAQVKSQAAQREKTLSTMKRSVRAPEQPAAQPSHLGWLPVAAVVLGAAAFGVALGRAMRPNA